MKRHSITSILDKMQCLTMRSLQPKYDEPGIRKLNRIRTAAVNEIIRLQVEEDFCKAVQSKIDMQEETDKLFDAVGIICKDYNDKILKP